MSDELTAKAIKLRNELRALELEKAKAEGTVEQLRGQLETLGLEIKKVGLTEETLLEEIKSLSEIIAEEGAKLSKEIDEHLSTITQIKETLNGT